MDTVRWGLLPTANINRKVIPAIRASSRGELVAVASRELARAEAYATEWGIPRAFGSYEALLESDAIDAVYISLPNHLHAEWSIRALQAGKHVLCEKPLALTLAEVDRMAAASRETGRILAEAFMYLHHPQTLLAGEAVRSGLIGEPYLVRAVFNFTVTNRQNIRLVPEWGGGSLWDVGVYPVSFARSIFGEAPTWVAGSQQVGASGVDEAFAGLLHYAGGRAAQVACAFQASFYTAAEVIGTEGSLFLNRPFTNLEEGRQMLLAPRDGELRELPVPDMPLYLGEIQDMHATILDGAPPRLSLATSRDHVRTVLALYEAARSGKTVVL
jgi:D-xylose 1-dehydrogenase (NADP+, D-xylono-1,5-lactone-forming)